MDKILKRKGPPHLQWLLSFRSSTETLIVAKGSCYQHITDVVETTAADGVNFTLDGRIVSDNPQSRQ